MALPPPKVEEGGWTPALKQMALDIMDEILARPITIAISDTKSGAINTFQGVRDKLTKKKYGNLAEWRNDVYLVFTLAQNSPEQYAQDIGAEIQRFFDKKYAVLEEFSRFHFRTALSNIVNEIAELQTKLENEQTEK